MERRKIKKVHEEKMSEKNHIYPDIILAAERIYGSICAPVFNDEDEYEVLLLVNNDVYNDTAMSTNAKNYLLCTFGRHGISEFEIEGMLRNNYHSNRGKFGNKRMEIYGKRQEGVAYRAKTLRDEV